MSASTRRIFALLALLSALSLTACIIAPPTPAAAEYDDNSYLYDGHVYSHTLYSPYPLLLHPFYNPYFYPYASYPYPYIRPPYRHHPHPASSPSRTHPASSPSHPHPASSPSRTHPASSPSRTHPTSSPHKSPGIKPAPRTYPLKSYSPRPHSSRPPSARPPSSGGHGARRR